MSLVSSITLAKVGCSKLSLLVTKYCKVKAANGLD